MKKYVLIDLETVLADSHSLDLIEYKKEDIVDAMIDADESIAAINIFKLIPKGEETDYNQVILLKPNGTLPMITHNEYDADIVLDKDEQWFGLVA